jgi:hypothetical protein
MSTIPYVPAFYYGVAHDGRRYAGESHSRTAHIRKFAQGAGSALLVFAGADSLSDSAHAAAAGTPPIVDFTSLDGVTQSLMTGGLTGPVQILAAALLFLAAGRCMARFLGLIAVAGVMSLYLQGVTPSEIIHFLGQFSERVGAAVSAFQSANTV